MAENSKSPTNFDEFSTVEFQQNVWNTLRATWESSFITLCKIGFIMDPNG
jgi:hypothetical protein